MNKLLQFKYLFFLLFLIVSCNEKNPHQTKGELEIVKPLKIDTLKFTSGISSIFQDSKGNYWFGSAQEGVGLYNGIFFEYFTINEGLSDNQIRSIQEDPNGNIWFRTARGINSYDGEKITDHTPMIIVNSSDEWNKTNDDLWFDAGTNEGIYRYDGLQLKYLAFPNPKIINPDNVYFVTSISAGSNDMLWIGTYAGVFGYNGHQFTIINDETLNLDYATGLLHIRSLLEDSKGRLWIGNNGIGVLLKENDSIINFSEKNSLIHPTSSRGGDQSQPGTLEHVFEIEEDSNGNIWFGDRDTGAWKYDGKSFTNYIIDGKLKSQMIWDIYEDQNKNLLFAMAAGGVYQFNGKSFERKF